MTLEEMCDRGRVGKFDFKEARKGYTDEKCGEGIHVLNIKSYEIDCPSESLCGESVKALKKATTGAYSTVRSRFVECGMVDA